MTMATFLTLACLAAILAPETAMAFSLVMSTPPFPPTGGFNRIPEPAPPPPSPAGLDYLSNLARGSSDTNSAMKPKNYSGMGRTFATTTSSNSYLDTVNSQPSSPSSDSSYTYTPSSYTPPPQPAAPQPSTSDGSYTYVPPSTTPPAPLPPSPPYASTTTPTAGAGLGGYLGGLSGAPGGAVKNYSGMGQSFKSSPAPSSGSYLDQMSASRPSPTYSSPPSPPVPSYPSYSTPSDAAPSSPAMASPSDYLSALGGGSRGNTPSGKNYSGMGSSFKTVAPSNSYLEQMAAASPTPTWSNPSYAAPVAPSDPTPSYTSSLPPAPASSGDYLSALSGSATVKSGKNYSGMGRSFQTSAPSSSYLDQMTSLTPSWSNPPSYAAPAVPVEPSYTAPTPSYAAHSYATPSAPATSGLDYLSALSGGSTTVKSGKNYSGMGSSFKTSSPSGSYLDQMAASRPTPSYSSPPAPAPPSTYATPAVPSYPSYSTPSYATPSPPPAPATSSGLDYLSALGGGNTVKKNYSGMGRSFKTSSSPSSYLEQMSAAPAANPPSYPAAVPSYTTPSYTAPSAPAPPASSGLDYLSALSGGSGGNTVKSGKNYSGMGNSFKSSSPSGSYLDQMGSVPPTSPPSYAAPSYVAPSSTPPAGRSFQASSPNTYVDQSVGPATPSSRSPMPNDPGYVQSVASAFKSGKKDYSWFGKKSPPSPPQIPAFAYSAPASSPASASAAKTGPNYYDPARVANMYMDPVRAAEAASAAAAANQQPPPQYVPPPGPVPIDPQEAAAAAAAVARAAGRAGPASAFGLIPPNNPFNYMGTLSGSRSRSRTSLGNVGPTNSYSESTKQNDAESIEIPDGPWHTYSADFDRHPPRSGSSTFWWEENTGSS